MSWKLHCFKDGKTLATQGGCGAQDARLKGAAHHAVQRPCASETDLLWDVCVYLSQPWNRDPAYT